MTSRLIKVATPIGLSVLIILVVCLYVRGRARVPPPSAMASMYIDAMEVIVCVDRMEEPGRHQDRPRSCLPYQPLVAPAPPRKHSMKKSTNMQWLGGCRFTSRCRRGRKTEAASRSSHPRVEKW